MSGCRLQLSNGHDSNQGSNGFMEETVFFDGRLRKLSLPVFRGPPPPEAAGPKRLLLAQGELANFYDHPEGIRYLAFLELRVGGIRGNHFHRKKLEHLYLISGRLLLAAKADENGGLISIQMETGDLVTIEPGICHALEPGEAGQAIEFSPNMFDAADIYKICVL
jgi:mannose-6-phosphate isomerase-like protein (cupin superfamily)